jgi:hypothetical protein
MLSVVHQQRYAKHRGVRDSQSARAVAVHELILPGMLFGSLGAIAWAVRGSNGWGGMDGTMVPGPMWGMLWFYTVSLCIGACDRRTKPTAAMEHFWTPHLLKPPFMSKHTLGACNICW